METSGWAAAIIREFGAAHRGRRPDSEGGAVVDIEILADAKAVAKKAAAAVAAAARDAVVATGRFVVAFSGGHTPWVMLRELAGEKVPWEQVHIVQVDERVAPAGHPDGRGHWFVTPENKLMICWRDTGTLEIFTRQNNWAMVGDNSVGEISGATRMDA